MPVRLLDWVRDLIQPIRRDDPLLGTVRYHRAARFWEGLLPLPSIQKDVEILLDGGLEAPTERQREFLRSVQTSIHLFLSEVESHLEQEALRVGAASNVFKLISVDLPEILEVAPVPEWKMYFESRPHDWNYEVTMRGRDVKSVTAEPV